MIEQPPETQAPAARVIGAKPRERTLLLPLLVISIVLHIIMALVVGGILSRHFAAKPEDQLDMGIDVTLGEAVQELIVAADTPPAPTPDVTPPPPPPTPEPPPPEPPVEPPPVMEKPEFAEPTPPPKPAAPPAVKREVAKATPKPAGAPPGAKVGPKPQAGVVGGNVTQGATTGTPGGAKVGNQGWRTPKPPYPPAALVSRLQASGSASISTDAAGNVTSCDVSGLSAPFDSNTRSYVRANWKGPPNSKRTFPVIYRLQ